MANKKSVIIWATLPNQMFHCGDKSDTIFRLNQDMVAKFNLTSKVFKFTCPVCETPLSVWRLAWWAGVDLDYAPSRLAGFPKQYHAEYAIAQDIPNKTKEILSGMEEEIVSKIITLQESAAQLKEYLKNVSTI